MTARAPTLPDWSPIQAVAPGQSLLIEASAGTGKTFQTEGLVLRLVCGFMDPGAAPMPVPIERLLIITFTRAAAAELRDRVRARLVQGRDLLRRLEHEDTVTTALLTKHEAADPIWVHLATASPARREGYLQCLQQALADYDQASISTIHSFCQEVLAEHGLAAGLDPGGLEQVDDTELLTRFAADLHAALVIRCSPKEHRHLKPNGWTLTGATDALQQNGSKLSPSELRPAFADFPEAPTVSEVAERMHAAVSKAVGDAASLAAEVAAWFESAPGQVLYKQLCDIKPAGFKYWTDEAKPVAALVRWLASQGADETTRDVKKWLKSLVELPTKRGVTAEMKAATPFFADIQARLQATFADLLAIALHGATRAVRTRQKRLGLQTFNSMIRDLADALTRERGQARQPLRKALRARFSVALVDEFQDTDNAQWDILREVFLDASSAKHRLIAVGDPKQSIYRFRGANLGVYEAARDQIQGQGGSVYRLPRNFRSDTEVMAAFNALFIDAPWSGAAAGSPPSANTSSGISYQSVQPRKAGLKRLRLPHPTPPEPGELPLDAPFELRWLGPSTKGLSSQKPLDKKVLNPLAAQAAANRIHAMLKAKVEVESSEDGWRAVRPDDFAVLTRGHAEARQVAAQLRLRGIPSIRRDKSSCFSGPVADWVVAWLEAVASPRSESAVRRLALTPLVGWTHQTLDTAVQADGPEWSGLRARIQSHADTWSKQGFGRRFQRFIDRSDALQRVVASPDGDVDANDLLAILDACDAAVRTQRLSPGALARWVQQQQADPVSSSDNPHTRTIATDAPSVVLSTLHASKGLQFPIVLVPYCWYEYLSSTTAPVIRYSTGSELVSDVHHKAHPGRSASKQQADPQIRAESMRLLYVALTRARHKAILWGACSKEDSAVHRLLKTSCKTTDVAALGTLPKPIQAIDEPRVDDAAPNTTGAPHDSDTLASVPPPRRWTGGIPQRWQNASYSSLSRGAKPKGAPAHDASDKDALGTPPEGAVQVVGAGAEGAQNGETAAGSKAEASTEASQHSAKLDLRTPPAPDLLKPIAWTGHPQGAAAGTWIHSVLEEVVFQPGSDGYLAKDGRSLSTLLADRARAEGVSQPVEPPPEDRVRCPHLLVADRIEGWLTTPLQGPGLVGLPDDFTLAHIAVADRIDELNFELRVGPGHGPSRPSAALDARDKALRRALEQAASGDILDPATRGWVTRLLARTRLETPELETPELETPDQGVQKREHVPVLTRFDGFLNGKIDLIFRHGSGDQQRFYVADYKTNALAGTDPMRDANQSWGPVGEGGVIPRLRRWHYCREVLAWSMDHSAYHLQSLLYTVALHRYLQARLKGYDPARHLGGHLYLYLRGMEGPDTATHGGARLGVWTDRWPAKTVEDVSDALTATPGGAA